MENDYCDICGAAVIPQYYEVRINAAVSEHISEARCTVCGHLNLKEAN